MKHNAETLVITHNSKGEEVPVGTPITLEPHVLSSLAERGIVKELKQAVETKQLKTDIVTK